MRPLTQFKISFTESLYEKAARSEGDAKEVLRLLYGVAKDKSIPVPVFDDK
jgi:hypothetical protein